MDIYIITDEEKEFNKRSMKKECSYLKKKDILKDVIQEKRGL